MGKKVPVRTVLDVMAVAGWLRKTDAFRRVYSSPASVPSRRLPPLDHYRHPQLKTSSPSAPRLHAIYGPRLGDGGEP